MPNVDVVGGVNACGAGAAKAPNLGVKVAKCKDELGFPDFELTISNPSGHPVYVTLAAGEARGQSAACGAGGDMDTLQRNVKVPARGEIKLRVPAEGNGEKDDAPFRITVRAKNKEVLGEVEGSFCPDFSYGQAPNKAPKPPVDVPPNRPAPGNGKKPQGAPFGLDVIA